MRYSFYVADAGISHLRPDTAEPELELDTSHGIGVQLARGYAFTPQLGAKIQVADLVEATLSPESEVGYQMLAASAPLNGLRQNNQQIGWSAFGRLGVGAMRNVSRSGIEYERRNSIQPLLGAGIEYGFNTTLALRAKHVWVDEDAQYTVLTTIG